MVHSKATFDDVTRKLTGALLRSLGPRSTAVAEQIRTGDFQGVASATFDFDAYGYDNDSLERFRRDYLGYNLVRKLDCLPTGIDTKAAALSSWMSAEETCALVNRLGKLYTPMAPLSAPHEAIISIARRKMAKLLGPLDLNRVTEACCFSGGASTRLQRRVGHPFYKFQGKPEVTREAALPAVAFIWSNQMWREYCQSVYGRESDPTTWVTIVPGGYLSTVPKDAKTDRIIVFEPEMNMLLQKGAGDFIRQRLKKVGINLNRQEDNQNLARIGSSTGSLATVDLSSASDSISIRIVKELLPADWFDWLDRIRSHRVSLDGRAASEWHLLHKFSSMGNGFTFELESAIFYCLAAAVIEHLRIEDTRLGVYGDDIILHHTAIPVLADVFQYVGFTFNRSKSFWKGPFRESCGKHYFLGVDVTPFYVKHSLHTLDQLYWFANSLRAWIDRTGSHDLVKVYKYAVTRIPCRLRFYVPSSLGFKAGLHASFDEVCPPYSKRRQAFRVRVYRETRQRHTINGVPALMSVLHAPSEPGVDRSYIQKGRAAYRHSWCYVAWWD